jgi:hypothetical protein
MIPEELANENFVINGQGFVFDGQKVTVVNSEKGRFIENAAYISMANSAMANKQYTQYSTYMALARSTGQQKYDVYFEYDGAEYKVERNEEISNNEVTTVEKTTVYDEDGQIVNVLFS